MEHVYQFGNIELTEHVQTIHWMLMWWQGHKALTRQHLATHMSIPFIHNARYLNLLPPHPGKLLRASCWMSFDFLLSSSLNLRLLANFFCCCLLRKTKEKRDMRLLVDTWLKYRPVHRQQRRRQTGSCWFDFAFVGDSRTELNGTGIRTDWVD